ncbi:MAG: NAD(P)H-dependent oxidoreductase [Mycobacteriaceae bacterium]|uniref:NAD(P)H-dependent oxidoreductase n=1 Tax=Corynebacterium sp. TaxID=1720 RepID=UPI003F99C086
MTSNQHSISHPPTPGSALWVYAHPRHESFNGELLRVGRDALSARYNVTTSDLYARGFDPVLGERDLGSQAGNPGNIAVQAGEAYTQGQTLVDVRAEHEKLADAELLVLQFPLWWYGTPAILKGWLDRTLTDSFAYGDLDPDTGVPLRYGDGGLTGRRALVIVTVGEDDRSMGSRGISGDIESILFPLTHGALWYVGIDVLELHVVYDADGLDAEGVEHEVSRLVERIDGLDGNGGGEPERPVPYRRLRDGDYAGTRALDGSILPGRTDLGIHRRE